VSICAFERVGEFLLVDALRRSLEAAQQIAQLFAC
jgi:hypothetical protein